MHSTSSSLVLLGLAVGMSLSSCRRGTSAQADPEWWQLEGDRVALAAKVELHQIRLEKHLSKSTKSGDLFSAREAQQAKAKQLTKRAEQLKDEIQDLAGQIAALHNESRQERRAASVGVKLDSLVGMNGREYRNVEISSVTDAGLVISHSSGIARLVATDLTREQQFEFGIDSELSQNAIARESRRASAYHRQVDAHAEKTLAKEQIAQEIAQQEKLAEQRAAAARIAARVSSTTSDNPLHQPARPFGTGSRYSSWGSRYGSYYPYYQAPNRTHYSYGSSRPTTRWSATSDANRNVYGTPVPTRPTPPRPPSPTPCPSN